MTNELSLILLVDDSPDDHEATVRSFKKNHLVNPLHWCKNGRDALDFVLQEGSHAGSPQSLIPSLIFLDLNMPGMDGRKVLKALKGDARSKQIPIVILTTSAATEDIEQCYAQGASTYIQKPVNFEGLVKAIGTMKDYWFDIALLPKGAPHNAGNTGEQIYPMFKG